MENKLKENISLFW